MCSARDALEIPTFRFALPTGFASRYRRFPTRDPRSGNGLSRVRVWAEVYTLTDPDVLLALVSAHQRGVDVKVLLDPSQPYNRHSFDGLRSAGVPVRWYPVPPGTLLHAKIGLFDAELLLGSANWTYSGLDVNHELDVDTQDPQALAAYGSRFTLDWERSPV